MAIAAGGVETESDSQDWIQQGQSAMTRGAFEQAAHHFAKALEHFAAEGDDRMRDRALLQLAEAQQSLGSHGAAVRNLEALLAGKERDSASTLA